LSEPTKITQTNTLIKILDIIKHNFVFAE